VSCGHQGKTRRSQLRRPQLLNGWGRFSSGRKQVNQIGRPEKRIGKDGKSYPAAAIYSAEDADDEEGGAGFLQAVTSDPVLFLA
jgi:hypothetical protein